MFGFQRGKITRALRSAFSDCFDPLKDELGNVPIDMQSSEVITAYMLAVCQRYAELHEIRQPKTIAQITDAVFEEVFRRDATQVLTRVDQWKESQNAAFMDAYHSAYKRVTQTLELNWLQDYATEHFEPANNLML